MRCISGVLLAMLCLTGRALGQNAPIALSASEPSRLLTSGEFLADPDDQWTIDALLEGDSTVNFQPFSVDNPGYVDSVKNYWIRFSFQNTDTTDREWILNFNGWSIVTLYSLFQGESTRVQKTGHLLPCGERDYLVANKNNILTLLRRSATHTFLVHLQAKPDHVIAPSGLGFSAALRSVQDRKDDRDRQIISIFIGIYAVMFLYNLFIYISTKEKSYVFYLLFILGLIYMTLNNAGYTVSIFGSVFDDFPKNRGTVESLASAFNTIVVIFFTRTFLNTQQHLPFWDRVLKFISIAIVITAVGTITLFEYFRPIAALLMIFILVSFIVVGIKSVRKKVPSAPYYLLAYIFSIAGTAVLALAFLGVLPLNDFTLNYSMPTGHAMQILFFSFALANRINVLKKTNEENQRQIIIQLKENEQFQIRATQELEEKVVQRTKEVVKQKELIEEEKEKSENLLYNILPQAVAKELIETGSTRPARYDEVSILFTDFVDFTNISASIPPARLVQELNDIFYAFDDIVTDLGLEKIKTIGDSYMAVCGLPVERKNHAVLCVQAALAMLKCIEDRNEHSAIKWHVRAGIHSGPVVAGVVGKKKFTFDLWGDTVNLASRMESNGVQGSVNISAYTYDLVREHFNCAYRGKIDIKGKGVIDMYYVDQNPE